MTQQPTDEESGGAVLAPARKEALTVSTVPNVNALDRGLEILLFLNGRYFASVAEIARGVALPRTTTFRLLETLCRSGYVIRMDWGGRYCLTSKVRKLAEGYDTASWVAEVARPHIRALTRDLIWPVVVAVPVGSSMVWRESSEWESPLVIKRHPLGYKFDILDAATGLVYLAFLAEDGAMDHLPVDIRNGVSGHFGSDEEFEQVIAHVRQDGYSLYLGGQWAEGVLAVPVMSRGRFFASLGLRYAKRTIPPDEAKERFLEPLRSTAAKIASDVDGLSIPELVDAAEA